MTNKSVEETQLKIRLPLSLKALIKEEADKDKRSMNDIILIKLENSFCHEKIEIKGVDVAPYLLLDRKKELASRLIKAIEWNELKHGKVIKYSHLAQALDHETATLALEWLKGEKEPSFLELDEIADFLGVNREWLKHDDGEMDAQNS